MEIIVRCMKCKELVARTDLDELTIPVRGRMFKPRIGCEYWSMPGPDDIPRDLVCPHAYYGDKHLFVDLVDNQIDGGVVVLDQDFKEHRIQADLCQCGCGQPKKEKYADGIRCYRRHMAQLKQVESENRDD